MELKFIKTFNSPNESLVFMGSTTGAPNVSNVSNAPSATSTLKKHDCHEIDTTTTYYYVIFSHTINKDTGRIRDFGFTLYVCEKFDPRPSKAGEIFATHHCSDVVEDNVHYISSQEVFIEDFVVYEHYRSMGFGSVLIEHLISYSKQLGATSIKGALSRVDATTPENIAKREGVYRKHGFSISPNGVSLGLKPNTT